MKRTRQTFALGLAAVTLPVALLNLGGTTAGASTWTSFKLPGGFPNGSEPGIDAGFDAAGNEVLYVHATYGVPGHNKAWIRQPTLPGYTGPNAYKPITFGGNYGRLPGGGDADIAFRGNELFFIDLWVGSNSIAYSPDRGATWTQGTPFTSLPLSDRQWIALGKQQANPVTGKLENTVYVAYQTFQPGDGVWLARSRDNGLTWDFHTPVGGLTDIVDGIPAHIVSDGGDTVAVAANVGATANGGAYTVSVSRDAGATWTVTPVAGTRKDAIGWATGFAMNPSNPQEMAVTYEAGNNAADHLTSNKTVVRVSKDGGSTWSDMTRLQPDSDPLGPVDWFPWVDYRGDKIAVTWYQSNVYMPQRDPNMNATGLKWDVYYSESVNDGATFSLPERVTTMAAKSGPICTLGLSCNTTGGGNRELGDFMQVAIDAAGKSHIAMVHASAGASGTGIYIYKQS